MASPIVDFQWSGDITAVVSAVNAVLRKMHDDKLGSGPLAPLLIDGRTITGVPSSTLWTTFMAQLAQCIANSGGAGTWGSKIKDIVDHCVIDLCTQ